ncbi:MAG: hypothetical protein JW869_00855 [Candidatus Omnitrophica bacterium]|nr:hypothetical protein [Candidatus Omnitrophota bacterium]
MKKVFLGAICVALLFSFCFAGCGAKKAESSKAAIEQAKTMETVEQKADYLIGQAKAFYSSKEFQDAIDVAQYILRYLDKDSQEAKDLVNKAKDALAAQAQKVMEDAKKGLSEFGK